MLQSSDAFLIIERAKPYAIGDALPLSKAKAVLGRTGQEFEPDFSFLSPYVSRQHATIEYMDGRYILTDLGSRHGTWINNVRLAPGVSHKVEAGDRISLASEEVVLTFAAGALIAGETWDYPESQSEAWQKELITVVQERREVFKEGQVLMPPLSGKLYNLLELLYDNQGCAVSDVDIKKAVWPERGLGTDGMPLVTDEEVTTLVYRLRKRLEPHGELIRTVTGHGYLLDLPR